MGFEAWGKRCGKTGWEEARSGMVSECRVALAICKSFWEKRGSARVGEVGYGGNAITLHPMLSCNATVE